MDFPGHLTLVTLLSCKETVPKSGAWMWLATFANVTVILL